MASPETRVQHNNRKRRSLRWRIAGMSRAFRLGDVIPDQGLQKVGDDGRIYTVAKLPIALWVATDDSDIAHAELGKKIEQAFGPIAWDAGSDNARSTGDLVEARFGGQ